MIDTHVHYSHKRFDCGRDLLLHELHGDCDSQSAENETEILAETSDLYRLEYALEAAIDVKSNLLMLEMLKDYPWIFFSVGYHPSRVDYCPFHDESATKMLRACIQKKRVIAVGETGLDYHLFGGYLKAYPSFDVTTVLMRQELWFRRQLDLAYEYELPLVLHIRDAQEEDMALIREASGEMLPNATERALRILKEYDYRQKSGVVHCFYGSYETACRYLECGDFVFGIGGFLTYGYDALSEAVTLLDADRLVLETDAPFVRPRNVSGGRNHSGNLCAVTAQIAALRGISEEEVIALTDTNAKRVFAFEQP